MVRPLVLQRNRTHSKQLTGKTYCPLKVLRNCYINMATQLRVKDTPGTAGSANAGHSLNVGLDRGIADSISVTRYFHACR